MANEKKNHEPLFHIVKRSSAPLKLSIPVRIGAVVLAFLVCTLIVVLMTGRSPVDFFTSMVEGMAKTSRRFWIFLYKTATLLCVALALTPAFKMKFWNIGGNGQALIGALSTTAIMFYFGGKIPNGLLWAFMLVASLVSGMIWAVLPAIFKAKWNTNETLFTLMLNYVAMQLVTFAIVFWENPSGSNTVGIINAAGQKGWFPSIFGNMYGLNVIVVLIITLGMYVYMKYSKQGYEIAVVGESQNTARYAGINVKKVIIRTMMLSGAICGIAGCLIVSGASHTISTSTAGGRGFTAIIVAWMSKFNPFAMILVSAFLVFMQQGSIQIASQFGLNENASDIITGILLFFLIGCEFFINYKLEWKKNHKEGK